ncbi:MAG: hypothetical protein IPK76_14070 [Lewinellaceae bacterium]|nr:hypothetical protein [Lewinellaceae bacterium]
MMYHLHFGPFLRLSAACLLLFSTLHLKAQDDDHPNLYTGASSAILPKDATEINLINSINSFWIAQNEFDGSIEATRITNRARFSRADHILRVLHGFSKSGRWDMGAEIYYTRARLDDQARSTPFRVYGNAFPESGTTYNGVSYIGVQVRGMPFAGLPELTLRGGYNHPIANTPEKRLNLFAQRPVAYLNALFIERLGPMLLGQVQGDFRTYFRNDENTRTLLAPSASGYLIFEIGEKWYLLGGMSYNLTFQQSFKGASILKANQQLYGSLGAIYRPGRLLSVILSGQVPFIFDSGSSYSVWVRESYVGLNLGLRVLL